MSITCTIGWPAHPVFSSTRPEHLMFHNIHQAFDITRSSENDYQHIPPPAASTLPRGVSEWQG